MLGKIRNIFSRVMRLNIDSGWQGVFGVLAPCLCPCNRVSSSLGVKNRWPYHDRSSPKSY